MTFPALDQLPFTISNLPYGIISYASQPEPRCAVAIGHHAVDLASYARTGALSQAVPSADRVFAEPALNTFAALPWTARKAVRCKLQADLQDGKVPDSCLVPLDEVTCHLPMKIGGYSDFYTSLEHCLNCSKGMSRSGIAKNWFYAPSVYNSRVSSIVPTPTEVRRPKNVYFSDGIDSEPAYGPSRLMDYELEMGYFVSKPVPYGERMPIENAKEHIFGRSMFFAELMNYTRPADAKLSKGFVLLNDWSARDHQLFEMRPLGPFHSKGFGTSISNWITPIEALEPFSCPPNTQQDPAPFPHLTWPTPENGALDIKLKVTLVRNGQKTTLGTSNLSYMYWTPYQQLTHHAQSGCGMRTGDLIGTGTISGSGTNENGEKTELGCLYEAAQTSTKLVPQGTRQYAEGYLEDGDEIILEAWCEDGSGAIKLGLGECRGTLTPAI